MDAPISDQEKCNIVSRFIIHAPPGEFNEVFNDVRTLLNSDKLLKSGATNAIIKHNEEQFVPVTCSGLEPCLVTSHAAQGGDRYLDPKSKKTFKFDHLRKEASDVKSSKSDAKVEGYRAALEKVWSEHTKDHYPHGVSSVYGSNQTIVACIEDHKFNPKNFYNGRWRGEWTVSLSGSSAKLKGVLRIQVHYYEDGNVQLVTSKEVHEDISFNGEADLAKQVLKIAAQEENEYQSAISMNYKTMSDTTFKALRRALPVTRTKLDWNKIAGYKVAKDLL